MAYESFRDRVNQLDNAGELVRIPQPVATELAGRVIMKAGGSKSLLPTREFKV
jgi:hypothetical protein